VVDANSPLLLGSGDHIYRNLEGTKDDGERKRRDRGRVRKVVYIIFWKASLS